MKIAFLSCNNLAGYVVDDDLLARGLTKEGHSVETVSWNADVKWDQFDCAIIRTTWDYLEQPEDFLKTLGLIANQTRLYNSFETIKWNIHKSYLLKLKQKGITIVPTVFFSADLPLIIPNDWPQDKVVLKPTISAGSHKTLVFSRAQIAEGVYKKELYDGDWMCQPFLTQIREGETSLIYFNKKFSHSLLKVPKPNEFRVQEEFGGEIIPLKATEELLKLGEKIINSIPDQLLYARIDLVPFNNSYALMELELIEPSLYFRTSEHSVDNFIKALYEE